MNRRSLIVLGLILVSVLAVAETKLTATGPYCWAGNDDSGKAIFVPCHQNQQYGIADINLDVDTLSGLKIHIGTETITVSREQVLKALAGWREENRAKP